ncbi:IS3 family transposase [Paenibacillus arenosi]|uniref:IS3 family transposase n=1 Tax=Paenibacillus arenosi TaxID=2774142 RepID=A0ABR9AWK4_9BACL|nr:IS3 family transposase [Paenibacillus arenosi]MBD8498512.1 IS3 family transposase [Paenibacillus arenosi]
MKRLRKSFTKHEIELLSKNSNVLHVSEKNITYSPTFKVASIQAYQQGKTPLDIFVDAGFPTEIIGRNTPKKCLHRWRNIYSEYGEDGLLYDRRGKASTGRSTKDALTLDEKLRCAEARIKMLEAENELLKKLEALERLTNKALTPSERFELIHQVLCKYKLHRVTRFLCQIAEVSRSGYYRWCNAEVQRQLRKTVDERDFQLINEHFEARNRKAGALDIKMRLERIDNVVMNHKKIRRIMHKFKLITSIRRANPYRKMAKATQEHKTCPNLLNRVFDQGEPEKVLLTDITYISYGNGKWAYLSCIKDGSTRQILAHYLSSSLGISLVQETIDRLMERFDGYVHPEAIFHSDQGMHYTNPNIQKQIAELGFQQSMSRKGNCWDNASMESFFGHLKDELDYKQCTNLEELRICVDEYITFYNSHRYQWTLNKMTPDEFRSHLIAA